MRQTDRVPHASEPDRIDAIQQLALVAFARRGITGAVERDPDDPVDTAIRCEDGRVFGLANLTLLCLGSPRWRWRALVRKHVANLTASMADDGPVDLHDPERRAQLRSRLFALDRFPVLPEYTRAVAPGMIEVLCLDQPTTVVTVADESVAGHDLDALYSLARSQLRFERFERTVHEETGIVELTGASFFTASHVLDPAFVERETAGAAGLVFLATDRHHLRLVRVDGVEAVHAIGVLARFAQEVDLAGAPGGALSRSLWFHDGSALEEIEVTNDDEQLGIRPGERLLAALQR